MGEHFDKELSHPGWMVGAQVLQPAVPVQDSKEPGQPTGHLVHQVTPDRPEHKVLTYLEYRAVSRVFQNIDPPPLSPPSECVLPPAPKVHTRRAVRGGGGVNILEDEGET
jgi:hypothetical protein